MQQDRDTTGKRSQEQPTRHAADDWPVCLQPTGPVGADSGHIYSAKHTCQPRIVTFFRPWLRVEQVVRCILWSMSVHKEMHAAQ